MIFSCRMFLPSVGTMDGNIGSKLTSKQHEIHDSFLFFFFLNKESDANIRLLPLSKNSPRKVVFPQKSIFEEETNFSYFDTKYCCAI